MKITKKQLTQLIENYFYENDDADAESQSEEELPPEEPAEEEAASSEEEESNDTEEEEPVKIENPKSFKIEDALGNISTIKFEKETNSEDGKMIVKVDGKKFSNANKSDMLALAGIGLQGVEDEVTRKILNKIVQAMDTGLQKFGDDAGKTSAFIGKKIAGSRPPFNDIGKIIKKAKG
jgi:hypothetical protein